MGDRRTVHRKLTIKPDPWRDLVPGQSRSLRSTQASYPQSYLEGFSGSNQEEQNQHEAQQPQIQPHEYTLDQAESGISLLQQSDIFGFDSQAPDVFPPYFNPEMLDFFPNGEVPDLSLPDMNHHSLDHFEIGSRNNNHHAAGGIAMSTTRDVSELGVYG